MKIQILGDAGVGKTSLRKKLVQEPFDPNENINSNKVFNIEVSHPIQWKCIKSSADEFNKEVLQYLGNSIMNEGAHIQNDKIKCNVRPWDVCESILTWSFLLIAVALSMCDCDFTKSIANICFLFILIKPNIFLAWFTTSLRFHISILLGSFASLLIHISHMYLYIVILHLVYFYLDNWILQTYQLLPFIIFMNLAITLFSFLLVVIVHFPNLLAAMYLSLAHIIPHASNIFNEVYIDLAGKLDECTAILYSILTPFIVGLILYCIDLFFIRNRFRYRSTLMCKLLENNTIHKAAWVTLTITAIHVVLYVYDVPTRFIFASHVSYTLSVAYGMEELHKGLQAYHKVGKFIGFLANLILFTTLILSTVKSVISLFQDEIMRCVFFTLLTVLISIIVWFGNTSESAKQVWNVTFRSSLKLSLYDFSGRKLHTPTHRVFIAPYAIFLLVFNLTRFARDMDRELKRLNVWLHSIHTYAKDNRSKIFLVGTNMGSLSNEIREEIATYLKNTLCNHSSCYSDRLVLNVRDDTPLWCVENSARDAAIHYIWEQKILRLIYNDRQLMQFKIESFAVANTDGYEIPIYWLKFKAIINQFQNTDLQSQSRPNTQLFDIMSFSDVCKVGKEYGINTSQEMTKVLQYFNASGDVIYNHRETILRQVVVLKPRILADAFRCIMNIPPPRFRDLQYTSQWSHLQEQGVLDSKLLTHIMTADFKINNHWLRDVIILLQCYNLIVPITRFPSPPRTLSVQGYIVPSLIPVYEEDPGQLGPEKPLRRFYFDFGFSRAEDILAQLMSKCHVMSSKCHLFSNVGRFIGEFSFRLEINDCIPEQNLIVASISEDSTLNPYMLANRLYNFMEAIRRRDYPHLKYKFGELCTFPGNDHEGNMREDALHILPICVQGEEFPLLESTITRSCNGHEQKILLKKRQPECNHGDSVRSLQRNDLNSFSSMAASITPNPDLHDDPRLFDLYVICNEQDNGWVEDNLVNRIRDSSLYRRPAVKMNSYRGPYCIENSHPFIRCCRLVLIVLSRISIIDERCKWEREWAYSSHDPDGIIHVVKENRDDVTREAFDYSCLNFDECEQKGQLDIFDERLHELVRTALFPE